MSNLTKNLCNFNLFPLVECSPDDKNMQLSRFIHIRCCLNTVRVRFCINQQSIIDFTIIYKSGALACFIFSGIGGDIAK